MRIVVRLLLLAAVGTGALVASRALDARPARSPSPSAVIGTAAQDLPSSTPSATGQVAPAGKGALMTLTFTEDQLTTSARTELPGSFAGVTLTDPTVHLRPGTVELGGQARFGFVSGVLLVTAMPQVTLGRPVANITAASIGGISLPDGIRQSLSDAVQAQIDALLPPTVQVTSISIVAGTMTVQARVDYT